MVKEMSKGEGAATPAVDISTDIERFAELGVLGTLLADRSTGGNIIWASNVYSDKGESYAPEDEIFVRDVTGENAGIIRTRASKNRDDQVALTRAHAEVFTPLWVVRKMVRWADEAWYESHDYGKRTWQAYVQSPRLEITCGEAPYLVSRYDATDGTRIPVYRRCGVLDRKLMKVVKHTTTRRSWWQWVLRALRSTYGYEYQGDNLLIARVNVLATLEDFCDTSGWEPFTPGEYRMLAEIISWNLWQMDGLTDCVPNGALGAQEEEFRLPGFDELFGTDGGQMEIGIARGRGGAKLYDWQNGHEVDFQALKREATLMDNEPRIKFDYIIGNPPYQDETLGDNDGYAPQIYNLFMEESYKVGHTVELVTPARFLFNAGSTPKAWNKKMLQDEHLKVLFYEPDAIKLFPNTDIKGGVAVTIRDEERNYGAIGVFSKHIEMNGIRQRVCTEQFKSFSKMVYSAYLFHLTERLYEDHPELRGSMSKGHQYDLKSNVFDNLERVFTEQDPCDGHEYVKMIGRTRAGRVYRYIRRDYLREVPNIDAYKIFLPKANGAGRFGEVLSQPVIMGPGTAATETFLSVGMFDTEEDARRALAYISTKFCRAMLGILKVTQDLTPGKWQYVPLQDFTSGSDIDWTQPIPEIDQQLYAKYGLAQDEIDFIESHVKEMQ